MSHNANANGSQPETFKLAVVGFHLASGVFPQTVCLQALVVLRSSGGRRTVGHAVTHCKFLSFQIASASDLAETGLLTKQMETSVRLPLHFGTRDLTCLSEISRIIKDSFTYSKTATVYHDHSTRMSQPASEWGQLPNY